MAAKVVFINQCFEFSYNLLIMKQKGERRKAKGERRKAEDIIDNIDFLIFLFLDLSYSFNNKRPW
jgi:hypothetical protein